MSRMKLIGFSDTPQEPTPNQIIFRHIASVTKPKQASIITDRIIKDLEEEGFEIVDYDNLDDHYDVQRVRELCVNPSEIEEEQW